MEYFTETVGPDRFQEFGIDEVYTLYSLTDLKGDHPQRKKPKTKPSPKSSDDKEGKRRKPTNKDCFDDDLTVKEMKTVNRNAPNTGRSISGFAGTIDLDRAKDIIPIEAFIGARKDLTRAGANTVFYNHDTDKAIGSVRSTEIVKGRGMLVEIAISKAGDVEDIWTKLQEGVLNSLSVRLRPKKVEINRNEEEGVIESFVIKEMELFEVSVVGLPMNPNASINSVLEKSFDRAKNTYNKKIRKSDMSERTQTITGVVKELVPVMIEEALEKSQKKTTDIMKGLMSDFMKELKSESTNTISAKEVIEKSSEGIKKNEKEDPNASLIAVVKGLTDTVEAFKISNSKRKGFAEEEHQNEEDDGIPKKVLKSAADPDTLTYVIYAANHEEVYGPLSKIDKSKVKNFYFQAYDAVNSK